MPQNKIKPKVRVKRACKLCLTAGKILRIHRNVRQPVLSYWVLLTCPRCKGEGFV